MKKILNIIMASGIVLIGLQCKKASDKSCQYSYDDTQTLFKWTAYKFVSKAGVSGTFNEIKAKGLQPSNHQGGVFENAEFEVLTNTVNSNNPERDKKLVDSFFGVLQNPMSIKARIKSIDNSDSGKALVMLDINGVQKEVQFSFHSSSDGQFDASADLDMADFGALPAIASLNKVCSELHTEKGVSKLWPDVKIEIKTKLDSTCSTS